MLELDRILKDVGPLKQDSRSEIVHHTLGCVGTQSMRHEMCGLFSAMHEQKRHVCLMSAPSDLDDTDIELWLDGLLQNYYGIMIFFVLRATLQTIFNFSSGQFRMDRDRDQADESFSNGWYCDLYRPMKSELAGEEVKFDKLLRALESREKCEHIEGLQRHCRTAAELLPVSQDAAVKDHIRQFFDIFHPKN